jgi:hypothetical protein
VPPGLTSEAGEAVLIAVTVGANIAAIEFALAADDARAIELGSAASTSLALLASTAVIVFIVPDDAGSPQMTKNNNTTVQSIRTVVVRNREDRNDCFMDTP